MSRDTNGKNYPVLGLSLGAGAINQLKLKDYEIRTVLRREQGRIVW